jgi:hypothetical protein
MKTKALHRRIWSILNFSLNNKGHQADPALNFYLHENSCGGEGWGADREIGLIKCGGVGAGGGGRDSILYIEDVPRKKGTCVLYATWLQYRCLEYMYI